MSRPPDLADRVAEFIAEHELLEPGQPLLTLVSGGADSLCLWGVMRELGHPVEALHVEHGLRGSRGLDDAAYCAVLGASVVPVDLEPGGNLEARAREARYGAARERAGGRPIATGHTLSDQAETVVYRLASSSGPRAISAMRPAADGVVRPLLCVTAAETRAWCAGQGLEPRDDETNADPAIPPQPDPARGDAGADAGASRSRAEPGAQRRAAGRARRSGVGAGRRPCQRGDRPRAGGGAAARAARAGAARGRGARRRAAAAAAQAADRAARATGGAARWRGAAVAGRRSRGRTRSHLPQLYRAFL